MLNATASADRSLAQKIEAADAAHIAAMAPARAPFAVMPAGGGYCVFAGAGSPMTHAVGIGMTGPVAAEELDRIEEFFRARGSACLIDLCPLADPGLIALLQSRPYRVTEFNNIVGRPIAPGERWTSPRARLVESLEMDSWSRLVTAGFADSDDCESVAHDLAGLSPERCFFADLDGHAAAGAAMSMRDRIAWMYGDATLPFARGQGLQSELISARLTDAAAHGCHMAIAAVLPGSGSHRNYARAGFSLLYMRVVLTRDLA